MDNIIKYGSIFLGILEIILIGLKTVKVVALSWWIILMPLWAFLFFALAILLTIFIIVFKSFKM